MKTIIVIILLVVAVVVYLACFAPLVEPTGPRRIIRAKGDISVLEITTAVLDVETNLTGIMDGPTQLNNRKLFEIFHSRGDNIIKRVGTDWEQQSRFTDPWGHDYIFLLQTVTNKINKFQYRLSVRSLGPNG